MKRGYPGMMIVSSVSLVVLMMMIVALASRWSTRKRRSRADALLAAELQAAAARVLAGERGVRLEALRFGRQSRMISRFNDLSGRAEGGDAAALTLLRAEIGTDAPDAQPRLTSTYVAIVKLNRFQALRASLGYRLANDVVGHLTARVRDTVAQCEVGRIGRTTIELSFPAADDVGAELQLTHLVAELERDLVIQGLTVQVRVQIGAARAVDGRIDDETIDQAATAIELARDAHVKVVIASDAGVTGDDVSDLDIARELRGGLHDGGMQIHYQPKLRCRDNSIDSAEALLRWTHPRLGVIPTDRFIIVAEETGAIRELTDWVIARVLDDQAWLAAQGRDLRFFVNLSGHLLPDRRFVADMIERIGTASSRIGLEITETAVIEDPDAAIANMQAISQAGIKVAIDDYGSGLSSLAYLKQLPADELKIDRMFVSGLTTSHRDPLLVRSSIDLAHALEMEVTAEGVDDPMAMALLSVMGCDLLQGYLISRPLARDDLLAFLQDDGELTSLLEAQSTLGVWSGTAGIAKEA